MSDIEKAVPQTSKQALETMEQVRDLFARSHDYISQATFPGHMGNKVAEVLSFLAFHYEDFKVRADKQKAIVEAEANAAESKVDVEAAKTATDAVLVEEKKA